MSILAQRRSGMWLLLRCVVPAAAVIGTTGAVRLEATSGGEEKSEMTDTQQHKHTNSLVKSTSPYLLQHAHNPVDWYEWGPEALAKAVADDKPIFLSIGYAACHWCHVMEHESFEKEDVADVMNEHFVAIKVDREERPDIDEIYMAYTTSTTGHGGWPMSVWLMPDGKPFFAGTYFPKENLLSVLGQIAHIWDNDREQLLTRSRSAESFFAQWASGPAPADGVIPQNVVDNTAVTMTRYFDKNTGGTSGGTNKFPPSMAMDLMLRVHRRTHDANLFDAVDLTLDHMSRGGIYDHLGGGICRYSTDTEWLVPHFEKMLYDQGMVSAIYLDGFQVTKNPQYSETAASIFEYVMGDLQAPDGGFYSSRDADSEGMEGKYYIWTVPEVERILGKEDGKLFCSFYDVTERGNWFESRGHAPPGAKNILHVTKPARTFAKIHNLGTSEFEQKLAVWREKMLKVRSERVPPGLDDKVLTGWNGLMIAALAKGARVLDEPRYAEAAGKAADFVLRKLRTPDGRLLRTYRDGKAHLTGYLSDYSFFIEGLLNLYEATFDVRWLDEAVKLTDLSIKYYEDAEGGAFFYTASDGEKLLARSKNRRDGAIPSGNSVHATNLLRLGILMDRKDYRQSAELLFRAFAPDVRSSPGAFERLCCAADFYHDRVKEIAIIGDPKLPATQALLREVDRRYLPNKVLALSPTDVDESPVALLARKTKRGGAPTAYVCENYLCKEPVTDPGALGKLLDAPK